LRSVKADQPGKTTPGTAGLPWVDASILPRPGRRSVLAAALLPLLPAALRGADEILIFAAASLSEVMPALAARMPPERQARFSFAASSTLARQIEQGAPAHLFISADEAWMDYLVQHGRVDAASRRVVAGNRLVVVRPGHAKADAALPETTAALRDALGPGRDGVDRIATGDPAHVPAGRYAQAALMRLGLWPETAPRLVRADNVRSALTFVERGEAAAGIVYATDARAARGVHIAARFPLGSHPPIRYPAACVVGAPRAARDFLDAIRSAAAQPIWRAAGFEPAA
jgi:molybdate transport system substrate-binding protein